jgi:hypothetical protein
LMRSSSVSSGGRWKQQRSRSSRGSWGQVQTPSAFSSWGATWLGTSLVASHSSGTKV